MSMTPLINLNGPLGGSEYDAFRQDANKEINNAVKEIRNLMSSLASDAAKASRDEAVSFKQMAENAGKVKEIISGLREFIDIASDWLDRDAREEVESFINDSTQQMSAFFVYISHKRMQEEKDKAKAEEERHKEFLRDNKDLIDQIAENFKEVDGRVAGSIDQIAQLEEDYLKADNGLRREMDRMLTKSQIENDKELLRRREKMFEIASLKMDEQQKEEIQKRLEEERMKIELQEQFFEDEMESNRSLLSLVFEELTGGLNDAHFGAKAFKSILDSINLQIIMNTLTQGADTIIDTMSDISRMRGMSYNEVSGIRTGLSVSDTYGGAIGAADIMKVYQMSNLREEYLEDIASSVAMFEKETGITNDTLNGLLLWAQNTGISRHRTVEVMDYLQSIRDNGAPVEDLAAFISENPALVSGHEEEYITTAGALRANNMNRVADIFEAIISNNNSAIAALQKDSSLAPLLAGNITQLEELANNQQYEELVLELVRRQDELAKQE